MNELPAGHGNLYRHIYEQVSDAIIVFRPEDERVLDVNPRACKLYGYSREEIIGVDLRTISRDPVYGRAAIDKTLRQGYFEGYETVHYRRDGSPLHLQINACVFEYNGAQAILSVNRDVSAQREAEERLKDSERQYRMMFECNPQPMWIFDSETLRFQAVNDAAIRLYGFTREQFLQMTPLDVRPPHERERFLAELRSAADFQPHAGQRTHCTSDGRLLLVRAHSHRLTFEGRDARFVLIFDVTEELRAREELANREAYYRALIENSRDVITILDAAGTVVYESPSAKLLTGRTFRADEGKSVFDHIHPADLDKAKQALQAGVEDRAGTETLEVRLRNEDGSWRTIEAIGHNLLHVPAVRGIVVNSRDVTERRNAEEALRRSEEHLRLAQLAGGIGTWEYHLRTEQARCSERDAVLGWGGAAPTHASDVLGLVHPDDRDEMGKALSDALHGRTSFSREFRVVKPDGTVRWMASRGELFRDASGEPERLIGINFDITDRKRVEQELAAARDAALEASKMKSQFLATVSHEIRTPMNGIIGMAGLLLDSKLSEEQRADASVIRTSALYLLDVINDLLDLSRIEAGKLSVETSAFDLRACLETVVDLLGPQASEKQLQIKLRYPSDLPRCFIGNAGRLRQIVLNFAGNAVKFTDTGWIRIDVAVQAPGRVRIAVVDSGPGISAEAQGKIFEKFSQVDGSPARRHGGTGLGLAISKSLAEVMGGKVGVYSVPDQGSEFWVELPLVPGGDGYDCSPTGEQHQPDAFSLYSGRVLIVEDNKVNQHLMVRLLEKHGLRVDVASNGREGLHMWASFPYDLVFMDCHMPELDGYGATARIRSGELPDRRVPIIAVTAFADPGETSRCYASGMDGVLTKPFQPHQLAAVLGAWLPHRRSFDDAPPAATPWCADQIGIGGGKKS